MQDPLKTYTTQLLREKGAPDSEWGEQSKEFREVFGQVNDAIDQAVFDALSEEGKTKVEQATPEELASGELVEQLLAANGVDSETVIKEALIKFGKEYLGKE